MGFREPYNIVDLSEMVDDLEQLITIEHLSNTEKKIIIILTEADYNYLTLEQIQKRTKIPYITVKRLIGKLEAFHIVYSVRDACKFVYLNTALIKKREIFKWVRLNAMRIGHLEDEVVALKKRVKELESR